MKQKLSSVLIMFFACMSVWAETLSGKVVRIADGDTFTLLVNKQQYRIRMYGIDAPETTDGQPYSKKSKEYLSSMIAGKKVSVEVKETDRYGRYLGVVGTPEVKDVNLEMIRAGMAWHYNYYDKTPAYKAAEQQARKARKGLWADPHPINPYEWRQGRR